VTREPDAQSLMRMKFQLALTIGDSLDLVPMVRGFIVPLLQSVQGLGCLVWLHEVQHATQCPTLIAYPQRRLDEWREDPALQAQLHRLTSEPSATPQTWQHGSQHHCLAMPIEREGWLVIETSGHALHPVVQEAIGVLLRRLARACRACHEHARAQQLLREREAAEQQRLLAQHRMLEVLALSTDGLVYFDDAACIALCNPAAAELLDRTSSSLIGRSARELDADLLPRLSAEGTAPSFEQRLRELAAQSPADGAAASSALNAQTGELSLQLPRPQHLVWSLRPVHANGLAVLYLRDVSHAVEVDRMKTEFLATAAHELRTPLASVLGFTELLLHREFSETKRRELLGIVHRQSELLVRLVQELLDLSRIEARSGKDFDIQPHALMDLVEAAVQHLSHPNDRARIHIDAATDLWVMADAEQIGLALMQLLNNACTFSPDDSPITVRTRSARYGEAPWGSIEVIDQGIGMTPEQLERAFERFYRADTSGHRPGTGLGLNLVKEIASVHGGSVSLSSEPGRGTTATLRLRLTPAHGVDLSGPAPILVPDAPPTVLTPGSLTRT